MEQTEEVLIVGAGVAGLATALALHRLGLRSTVLESSSNLRVSGYGILTWTNAWRALDALGVGNHLRERHLLLQEMQAVSTISGLVTSSASFMEKGKSGNHEVRCLIRKVLLETLAKDLPRGTIKYSSKVVHIEDAGCLKLVHLADGPIIKAKVLIGCDGVNSVVAKWLKLQRPIHTQRAAVRGIVQFPNGHGLEPKVLQHYGSGIRHGYAPCDEKSVYWFMTYVTSEKSKPPWK
uniref:Zeaxanthin epoxidase n=1 Tax=Opuntia streptacantha TaxID=393608 RepID=A0A7C8ZLJ3_OPUST